MSVVTLKDGGARVAVKAMSRYTASNDSQVRNFNDMHTFLGNFPPSLGIAVCCMFASNAMRTHPSLMTTTSRCVATATKTPLRESLGMCRTRPLMLVESTNLNA